ncbi:plasmid mobilization relaxosome protein MobC [Arcicella sp. LKC2W]|uniref:plasmid mobilization protein n=1 Tax=Arcicella sp. LKC2W TaxID=2984198 RepID=UPI002B2194EE|nr:plasmid mobilization relaxosome protein MobC [Arcicella sp. LKC2W]MEA5461648.1 plasmid mobilization relaxosome protein MobC [Arcicella sp. LKC2W]
MTSQAYPSKGGRPLKKYTLSKKSTVRFTPAEFEEISTKSAILKIKIPQYIRSMTLQGKVTNLFSEEEQNAKRQLIGIANNLNQLLKLAHREGVIMMIRKITEELDVIDQILLTYKNGSSRK